MNRLIRVWVTLMCEVFLKFSFIHTLFSYCCYSIIPIEKTSLIQYNKVSGRYLYEGKNTNH